MELKIKSFENEMWKKLNKMHCACDLLDLTDYNYYGYEIANQAKEVEELKTGIEKKLEELENIPCDLENGVISEDDALEFMDFLDYDLENLMASNETLNGLLGKFDEGRRYLK